MTPARPRKARPKPPPAPEAAVLAGVLALPRVVAGLSLFRRNVLALPNEQGRPIRSGAKGQADVYGWLTLKTPAGKVARVVEIECKSADFDPSRLAPRKDQTPHEHFRRQLDWLRRVNAAGGIAFWVTDAAQAERVVRWFIANPSGRVEFDGAGFPFLCD